jgi:hypothetical protein
MLTEAPFQFCRRVFWCDNAAAQFLLFKILKAPAEIGTTPAKRRTHLFPEL